MMKASGIVLAGGKSTRMGRDKANIRLGSQTMLERSVEKLQQIFDEVIIVSDRPSKYALTGTRQVFDIYGGKSPLGGIHAGLSVAGNSNAFITACDMPFWQPEMAAFLLQCLEDYDAAIPRVAGYIEPLFAVYSKRCLPAVEACLQQDIYKIIEVFPLLKVKYVEEEAWGKFGDTDKIFININTPQELKTLLRGMTV